MELSGFMKNIQKMKQVYGVLAASSLLAFSLALGIPSQAFAIPAGPFEQPGSVTGLFGTTEGSCASARTQADTLAALACNPNSARRTAKECVVEATGYLLGVTCKVTCEYECVVNEAKVKPTGAKPAASQPEVRKPAAENEIVPELNDKDLLDLIKLMN
jgi:hypothetical protein